MMKNNCLNCNFSKVFKWNCATVKEYLSSYPETQKPAISKLSTI